MIKKENLEIDRSESMSPTRVDSIKAKDDKNRSKSVAVSEEDSKLHGGLSGFFKCGRSGRVKSPEVKKEKEPKDIPFVSRTPACLAKHLMDVFSVKTVSTYHTSGAACLRG